MSDESTIDKFGDYSYITCEDPECHYADKFHTGHQHLMLKSSTVRRLANAVVENVSDEVPDFIPNKVSHIEESAYPSYDEVRAFMNRGIIPISDIVAPDAPIVTNAKGGSQSDAPVRFDLIDAKAMFEMAKILDHGAKKYGVNNWRLIDVDDHLNHLLMHTFAYLAGDDTDDHLSHILCRATFALGVKLAKQGVDNGKVD